MGLSVLFMGLFFATADLHRMLDVLAETNYLFVVPGVALYFVSILFRTLRWQVLLSHMRRVEVTRLYPVVVVGYMANNLLPVRLGELVRSHYIGERENVSKTAALATIVVERVLDALTLLLFIAAIAVFMPVGRLVEGFSDRYAIPTPLLVTGLSLPFIGVFVGLLAMAHAPSLTSATVAKVLGPAPQTIRVAVTDLVRLFLEGISPLRNSRTLLSLFAQSAPIWLFEAGLFYTIGLGFRLQDVVGGLGELGLVAVLVTAVANIGSSIPAAPGGVGLFELVARETLVLLPTVDADRALAGVYVAVVHLALLLPMIVAGQLFLWSEHLSLRRLVSAGHSTPPLSPGEGEETGS